ncbi:hypothetical protein IV102_31880 [bacterium]|nr:hypothetical protein [bacterium]
MKVQTTPGYSLANRLKKNPVSPQPAPDPKPQPPTHFLDSSRSLRRDALLAGALASTITLPKTAALGVGGVVGVLGLVASYGEIREGMRTMNTHEVIGGALHMGASTALLASAALQTSATVSGGLVGGLVAAGGLSMLAAKTLYDRPGDVADVVFRQPLNLVRDAGKSIWLEFRPPEKS